MTINANKVVPAYSGGLVTSVILKWLVEDYGATLVEVQHHHAHLASLMAESGIPSDEEIVAVDCDGYGYGVDGAPWGGEILVGGYEGFKRAGHLEPQPMPGGDLAAIRYGRMLQGILYSEDDPTAVIGTQVVHEGEKILDVTIVKINKDKVEFERDGKRWTQEVQP